MVNVGVGDDNVIYDFVHRTDFGNLSLVIELWKLKCGNAVRDTCHWSKVVNNPPVYNLDSRFESADTYSSTGQGSSDLYIRRRFSCRSLISFLFHPFEMLINLHTNVLYANFLFESVSV